MKILVVLTSHGQLGDTGEKTGYWYEELAAPYFRFLDRGAQLTLASPLGGEPPMDPMSNEPDYQTEETRRFDADADALAALASTVRLDSVSAGDFDAVFYPGGHGPLWDLVEDRHSIQLIEQFWRTGKPVATTCHGPAVLVRVTDETGAPLVSGLRVTGFANTEEEAVGRTEAVPFLLEDELVRLGGSYTKTEDWAPYVVEDGRLITGQNPHSSGPVADALLARLERAQG